MKKLAVAAIAAATLLTACSASQPTATLPASGVTASNGGGQRTLGNIPSVGVSNGRGTEHALSRNSVGPNDY